MSFRVSSDFKQFLSELAVAVVVIVSFGGAGWALSQLLLLILPESSDSIKYKAACIQVGGHPAHDGEQWQCLKEIK